MKPRIKVGPNGQIVVHEPTVAMPEWIEYRCGEVVRYWHGSEVEDWPEWGPLPPRAVVEGERYAKDVRAGWEVLINGKWFKVISGDYLSNAMRRTFRFEGRKAHKHVNVYDRLRVRYALPERDPHPQVVDAILEAWGQGRLTPTLMTQEGVSQWHDMARAAARAALGL